MSGYQQRFGKDTRKHGRVHRVDARRNFYDDMCMRYVMIDHFDNEELLETNVAVYSVLFILLI